MLSIPMDEKQSHRGVGIRRAQHAAPAVHLASIFVKVIFAVATTMGMEIAEKAISN